MAIIDTVTKLAKYIPTIKDVIEDDYNLYSAGIELAENEIESLLGSGVMSATDEKVKNLIEGLCARKGYLLSIPTLDLVQTESGFGVVGGSDYKVASKERVQALKDGLEKQFNTTLELLLMLLISKTSLHNAWSEGSLYGIVDNCIVGNVKSARLCKLATYMTAVDFALKRNLLLNYNNVLIKCYGRDFLQEVIDLPDYDYVKNELRTALICLLLEKDYTISMNNATRHLLNNVEDYPVFKDSEQHQKLLNSTSYSNSEDKSIFVCG